MPGGSEIDLVWDVIREHRGASRAISREALCEETGLPDRIVRKALHDLTVERGVPILSIRSGGYAVAETAAEVTRAADWYRRYAGELHERADALERAFVRSQVAQIALFEGGSL